MKKSLIIGLSIIFFGLIVSFYFYNVKHEKIYKENVKSVSDRWEISGYFDEGENLTLEFIQHSDWSLLYYLEPEDVIIYKKHLWVNVTRINDNSVFTTFKVMLVPPLGYTPPSPPYDFNLHIAEIEVTHHGALHVEDNPSIIGGIIKNSGEYLVICWLEPEYVVDKDTHGNPWPHPASPPRKLYLFATKNESMYPYRPFLPIGLFVILIGLTSFFLEYKKTKKRRKRRH